MPTMKDYNDYVKVGSVQPILFDLGELYQIIRLHIMWLPHSNTYDLPTLRADPDGPPRGETTKR